MSQIEISLLGPWRITQGDVPILVQAPAKLLSIFAFLAMQPGQTVGRRRMAELLWPEVTDTQAMQNLRQLLFRARRASPVAFDEMLIADANELALNRQAVHLDVQALLSTPANGPVAELTAAIEQYRGEFMQDVVPRCSEAFDEWQTLARARCEQHALQLLAALCTQLEHEGQPERALHHARHWLEIDNLQEQAYGFAARALLKLGKRTEALGLLGSADRLLSEGLGVGLNAELSALVAAARVGHAAPDSLDLPALPVPRTPLVGRTQELVALKQMLEQPDTKVVTVVGLGGSGKTRLALAVAHAFQDHPAAASSDGVIFLKMDAADGFDDMLQVFENAFGLDATSGNMERQIARFAQNRRMLLVLDNFEHLVAFAARLLQLFEQAPGTRMLFTSRIPLNVYGEHLFPLAGLVDARESGTQGSLTSAVSLFIQCARRVDARFAVDEAGEAAIARICLLVSAMPLAIELAAAWTPGMTPHAIATELERNQNLLDDTAIADDAGRSSMQSALNWAWQRLATSEQQALAALSVFRGGFAADAARAVAGCGPQQLRSLVRRALLRFLPEQDENGRFELLELVRIFAQNNLAGAARGAAEHAHAAWYVNMVRRDAPKLEQLDSATAQARLHTELANVRAAWMFAVRTRDETLLESGAHGIATIFGSWGHGREGAGLLALGIDAANTPALRARLRVGHAHVLHLAGDSSAARDQMQRALDPASGLPDDAVERAEGALMLARIHHVLSEPKMAAQVIETAIGHAKSLRLRLESMPEVDAGLLRRVRSVESIALAWKGNIAYQVLAIPDALRDLHEAVAIAQAGRLEFAEADARRGLGRVLVELGHVEEARLHLDPALAAFQALRNPYSEFLVRQHCFLLGLHTFSFDLAAEHLRTSRALTGNDDGPLLLGFAGYAQTLLFDRIGDFASARAQADATIQRYKDAGYLKGVAEATFLRSLIDLRFGSVTQALAHAHEAELLARQVGHHQTVAAAQIVAGCASIRQGELDLATSRFAQAHAALHQLHLHGHEVDALTGLAQVALARGNLRHAQEIVDQLLAPKYESVSVISQDPVWQQSTCLCVLRAAGDARAQTVHARLSARISHGLASLKTGAECEMFRQAPGVAAILEHEVAREPQP